MAVEKIDTLVVGAGQAGLAMSEHLSKCEVPHIVLERHRIAERWRSERWDSLVANGPAWHDRFPGMAFKNTDSDGFAPKGQIVEYFVDYAEMIEAPIRCGVEVKRVERLAGRPGYRVETSEGALEAMNVVAATGPFQDPIVPAFIPDRQDLLQIHSSAYRNPAALPEGGVLVVGAGSSGSQIADELLRDGRSTYLSIGSHDRPPRAYRGRDFSWWLGVLGKWDAERPGPAAKHVTIAVSGARGGKTVDFRRLAASGMTLLGRANSYRDGKINFSNNLKEDLERGDAYYASVLEEADRYVVDNGLDLPDDPDARKVERLPRCVSDPVLSLDLSECNVRSIIWATGFSADYSWLIPGTFAKGATVKHHRGVSKEPGVYFLGLPWQSSRASSFIWGVWHDAKFIADHIVTRRNYLNYFDFENSA